MELPTPTEGDFKELALSAWTKVVLCHCETVRAHWSFGVLAYACVVRLGED